MHNKNEVINSHRRSTRLEAGLDNLNANTMIVDQTGSIIYFNASLKAYLKELEPKIKQQISDFKLENLLGKNILCLFEKSPEILEGVNSLTESKQFKFEFFGAQLQLQISPIFAGDAQKPLGMVIEWQDIFQELYVQESIKTLVQDANNGRLHSRVDTTELDGFYHDLSADINSLMDNLQNTLKDITVLIGGLSTKDLTVTTQAEHSGQYGWTIRNLVSGIESLRLSFCRVTNQASEVQQSADHVSQSNQELATSIRDQSQQLNSAARTMRLITNKVNETSVQAGTSNDLAIKTRESIEISNQNMQETIGAMQEINEVSQQITGIVTLIDSIAFQTNLLALNAAVEAARAGEHGRGFAVVAGEVRSLAQKSADAAKDIKTLIEKTADKISLGTEKVEKTGSSLESIISQVHDMTESISLIADNAHEQARQIDDVNETVKSLNKAADQNATLIMENSSLADYLGDVANNMDQLVGTFELGDCEEDQLDKEGLQSSIIVVADDNISNQKVASILIEKAGFEVKTAATGKDAIKQVERYRPVAVLMDIEMPEMDGLKATQALRKAGVNTPIFAYTGHSDNYNQIISESGMNDIIHKPSTLEEIESTLAKHSVKPNGAATRQMQLKRETTIASSDQAKEFAAMIEAHLGWKSKIRRFIDGADIGVTAEGASDYTACVLGKWYYQGAGQKLMHLPMMEQLGNTHMEMHQTIKLIMDAFHLDDYDTVMQGVDKVDVLSDSVVEMLNQLIDMVTDNKL